VFGTVPDGSAVEVFDLASGRSLGRLPLRGAANLSPVRPMGIDFCAERGLVAVGSRNGAVHLIKVEEKTPSFDRSTRAAFLPFSPREKVPRSGG
jgi:hypothetical protein